MKLHVLKSKLHMILNYVFLKINRAVDKYLQNIINVNIVTFILNLKIINSLFLIPGLIY